LVAVALFVCVEREAKACSCAPHLLENPREDELEMQLPVDGPIVVHSLGDDGVVVTLFDEADVPVPLARSEVAVGDEPSTLRFYRPTSELMLGSSYSLNTPAGGPHEVTAVAAAEKPEIPVVKTVRYREGTAGTCGNYHYAELELENESGIIVVDRDSESDFDPVKLSGSVSGLGTIIGRRACFSNWHAVDHGATARVRVGAINASGRFSGFGEAVTLRFPGDRETGCSLGGPRHRGDSGLALGMVLGLLAVLRGTGRRR
jgi:hypothetical protein